MAETPTCHSCGSPDDGELAHCRFCNAPLGGGSPIPCPGCRAQCRWGKQTCPACGAWIVVACVFCGAISPYNVPACLACHEAFAGAPERKAQRDRERATQQASQETAQVVGALGSILGAVVEAEIIAGRRRW